jgi:hypothetical protein
LKKTPCPAGPTGQTYRNGMACRAWCWAGLVGFGQVSFFLYFFLFDSFSFSSVFYLLIFICI